ncbi:RNA binding motif, single stranded interacting protein 3 [Amazona aestiva]|uniref:RNA binding motif, single stranded interacting protein 3 n=1 Tax=Amazona aestiva TaxID=12930 RepID=A0A0Q3LVR6_AMAAE|nr:RNA binding motif, single stranded interacting protein 3 [Amazona aestiva]
MGKRLDQQPMYPQYTYYYPHYLQTKLMARPSTRTFAKESRDAKDENFVNKHYAVGAGFELKFLDMCKDAI